VLLDLVPEFLDVLAARDPRGAWDAYRWRHRPLLDAYWRNYVLDPDDAQAEPLVQAVLRADRQDLRHLLATHDVEAIAADAAGRARSVLGISRGTDVVLMVGMGAANAGELVLDGRGVAFACLEHFTGRANPTTDGLGLPPALLAPWLAHELAHTVRYTATDSASELRRLVLDAGGYYDFWETGRRATLRELLLNEGLAVHAAQAVAPGFPLEAYLGFSRRQLHRVRELEAFLRRALAPDLDRCGLGLRLRYLCGGLPPSARMVEGRVIPERAGYYLGWRMAAPLVREVGIAGALRAAPAAFTEAEARHRAVQSA